MNRDYLTRFMAYYDYPSVAVEALNGLADRLEKGSAGQRFAAIVGDFTAREQEIRPYLEAVTLLAAEAGENEYTLTLLFLIASSETVLEKLRARGQEPLFWDTFSDLRYKLMECLACKGVPGNFVGFWYNDFYKLRLFRYGRFQYQLSEFALADEFVTASGKVLRRGDPTLNLHIPSSGIPLTDEVRMDSYKRAYAAYRDRFPDGIMVLRCHSWLLYPRHREFLPKNANILRFMDDFEVVAWQEEETFGDAWRVFGCYAERPIEEWPTDTSLRRAYADWMKAGNKSGYGACVLLFDGERILKGK